MALEAGFVYEYVRIRKAAFRRLICEAGLSSATPGIRPPFDNSYGVPFDELPNPLHDQIVDLLKRKTADFDPDVPPRATMRPISAEFLKREFCRVYGFCTKVLGKKVSTLQELISQEVITAFASWCLNQRKVSGRTVEIDLARICGLKWYPPLASIDFSWLPKLMAKLPKRHEEDIQAKKDGKWLRYEILAGIPERIRKDAVRDRSLSEIARAEMMRDALLIQLLSTLPWRQLNLRQCKIVPFAKEGNLYKEPVPANSRMKRSLWAEGKIRANPAEPIWQFFFRRHETKTGYVARGPLPIQLVGPLEEYLARYRGVLLRDHRDPTTLFFNRNGRPFNRKGIERIVGDKTMKYGKVRVNPHLVRDIWAVAWLEDHPADYITVMKTLFHRKIDTALKYGAGFDESHAAVRIEEWLDARNRAGQVSNATTGDAARLSGLLRELEQMIQQCPAKDVLNPVRAERMRHEMRRIVQSLMKWLNEQVAA
jgi:hypothetical protein